MGQINASQAAESRKADLIREALLAYAQKTIGRDRALCEALAAQAEEMAEAVL
jgi:hypothetical protein